mgnify:CR=1 FL=1
MNIPPPHGIPLPKFSLWQEIKAGPIEGIITGLEYTPPSLVKAQHGWVVGWGYYVCADLGIENPDQEFNWNIVEHVSEDEIEGVLT